MDSLATTSTALTDLSPDELSILEADRQKMGGSMPSIPQIRLSNKDMTQAPEGEYFTELYKGKDEEPEIRLRGPNPEVTILYKTNTYSYYTKEAGLVAWTSDIHGFTAMDDVTLFVKRDGKVSVDFHGPYPSFKLHKEKYVSRDEITGTTKNLLKFKTVLYVLFEGKPYKVFVSNASNAGVDQDGNPSFESPQPLSLQVFNDMLWREKRAAYEFTVRLGSRLIESSKPYYIMTFENVGETPADQLRTAMTARRDAEKAIYLIDDARRKGNGPTAQPIDPQEPINPDDLPF